MVRRLGVPSWRLRAPGVSGYDRHLYRANARGINAIMVDGHTEWIPMPKYVHRYTTSDPEYAIARRMH